MTAILGFFGSRVGQWVLIVGLAVIAAVAAGAHQRAIGYSKAMDEVAEQRAAEERAYLALLAKRQAAFDALTKAYVALALKREADLNAAEQKRQRDVAAALGKVPVYVSTASTQSCPDLPAGYVLFRRNAADLANGRDPSAPEPSPDAAAAPSGVSLPALAETDIGQAAAYRACAERVKGWEAYAADVEAWAAAVNLILKETP